MKKVICVGNATWDQTFSVKGEQKNAKKCYAHGFTVGGGGVAATASVAVANLGCPVEFIGRVGDDTIGEQIVVELENFNVGIQYCLKHKNTKSSIATVILDDQKTSKIYVFNDPNMPKDSSSLFDIDLSNVSAIVADLTWSEGATALFDRAQSLNIPTFLRVSFYDLSLIELMKTADYCIMTHPSLVAMTSDINIKKAMVKAQKIIGGKIVVTLANKGCAWLDTDKISELAAYPSEIIDTTGAGDVFIGTLATKIGEGESLNSAITTANKISALSCEVIGARNLNKES